jgi:enoyl-CoA hydratase
LDDAAAFARQDELIAGLASSEDVREGAAAFAEKRAPVWRGR